MCAEKLEILITAIDKASAPLKNIEKGLRDTGSPSVQNSLAGTGSAVGSIGTIASAIVKGGVLIAMAAQLKDTFDTTMRWGNAVDTLGDMFGMSGAEASTWSVAMQHVGLSVQEGGMQLNYFTRMLAEANEKLKAGEGEVTPFSRALDKLGVSAQNSAGKFKTFDDLMPEIMDAFKKLPAGVEATGIAMELFGARGGSKFLDFLRQGSAGLSDADAKARAFGLSMNTIDSNRVEELGFKLNDLGMRFEGMKVSIGLGLIDPLEGALGVIGQMIEGTKTLAGSLYDMGASLRVYMDQLGRAKDLALVGSIGEGPGQAVTGLDFSMDRAMRIAAANIPSGPIFGPPTPSMQQLYQPFGNAGARYAGMDIWAKGPAAQDALYRQYRKLLQDMQVTGAGGGARGGGMGLPDLLALAFGGNLGAAQGWQGAFAEKHGGRAPTAIDLRDRQASLLFAQKYGRGPSEEEWKARYYKGGFEGIDEKTAGLDELFGKPGTWDTLISEQTKAAQKQTKELADAFAKVMKGPIPVTIVGASGDGGGGDSSYAGVEHSSTVLARSRM